MAEKVLLQDRFYGGIADSEKEGVKHSFQFGRSIDFKSDPSKLTILPKTTKESGSTVVDLVKWAEVQGTDTYFYGDAGHIYKRTSAASWSDLRTVSNSSGNGLVYFKEDDYLYYALDSTLGRYGPMGGTPAFADDPFSDGTVDLDQQLNTSGNTYTTPASISETATNRQSFVPAKDPQKSVQINVNTVGTGNWTVTVHDAANNSIATKTITNASMSTGDVTFTFATAWRPIIGATYHFHVTSTVADGAVVTTTASDLETADFHTFYQILVTDVDFHPMTPFLNFIAVGNERYVATHNGISSDYNSMRVTLPSGYKVRALAVVGEYLAIGTWKGAAITDDDDGRIFFWDGTSSTYNFFLDVPEGGVQALLGGQNRLYYWAGTEGNLLYWNGETTLLKQVPKMTNQTYVEIFPGAVSLWQKEIRFGVAGNADNTSIEKGVYTWGSKNKNYPDVLSYDYPISTGTRTGNSLKISCVFGRGQTLFIGWVDNTTYGVDVVSSTAAPFADSTIEGLAFNNQRPFKDKIALVLRADFEALAANESIELQYDIDKSDSWSTAKVANTAGDTNLRVPITDRFKTFEWKCNLKTSGSTAPTLESIVLEFNDLGEEKLV